MPLPAALQARLKKRGLVVDERKVVGEEEVQVEKKKKKNYKHQPLPPGWFKVLDPESAHDYFWNVHTNQVAWRHPSDPRAEITYPASWQKKQEKENKDENAKNKNDDSSKKEKQKIKTGKHPSLMKAQRHKDRKQRNKDDDAIDPMDPAAYSDVARGTWSSGLRDDSEVNTGVDTTANGPLFQQRPYPSPGDILRRNKGKQANINDEDE